MTFRQFFWSSEFFSAGGSFVVKLLIGYRAASPPCGNRDHHEPGEKSNENPEKGRCFFHLKTLAVLTVTSVIVKRRDAKTR